MPAVHQYRSITLSASTQIVLGCCFAHCPPPLLGPPPSPRSLYVHKGLFCVERPPSARQTEQDRPPVLTALWCPRLQAPSSPPPPVVTGPVGAPLLRGALRTSRSSPCRHAGIAPQWLRTRNSLTRVLLQGRKWVCQEDDCFLASRLCVCVCVCADDLSVLSSLPSHNLSSSFRCNPFLPGLCSSLG